MVREIEYPTYSASVGPVAGVSWGAVFAGAFVTIATMASLTMLGGGIGLASAPAADSAGSLAKGFGIGAAVWLLLSGIISFFAGGWITGRLTRTGIVSESVVHSAVTWAFATTAFMFLLTSAIGGAIGGAANMIGSAAGGATQAASSPAGQRLADQASGAVDRLADQARANAPTQREMVQKAESAAKMAGATGIAGFLLMLLELLACAAGARAGTRVLRPRTVHGRTKEPAMS